MTCRLFCVDGIYRRYQCMLSARGISRSGHTLRAGKGIAWRRCMRGLKYEKMSAMLSAVKRGDKAPQPSMKTGLACAPMRASSQFPSIKDWAASIFSAFTVISYSTLHTMYADLRNFVISINNMSMAYNNDKISPKRRPW